MAPVVDIFTRLPDGSPVWVKAVEGLDNARSRVRGSQRARSARLHFRTNSPGRPSKTLKFSESEGGNIWRPETAALWITPHL
jgi:hypothetical protein